MIEFEFNRTGPDAHEGIRQLVANLRQQNHQITADRDRYAAWMVEAREQADRLRAERDLLIEALWRLWEAYLPSWAPGAAIDAGDHLHSAWRLAAESLVAAESKKDAV